MQTIKRFSGITLVLTLTYLPGLSAQYTLEDLVVPGANVEVVAEGFVFTEGPVWDGKGSLLFSDVRVNKIMRLGTDGKISVYIDDIGTNGLYLDNDGLLIVCGNLRDRVLYKIMADQGGYRSLSARWLTGGRNPTTQGFHQRDLRRSRAENIIHNRWYCSNENRHASGRCVALIVVL